MSVELQNSRLVRKRSSEFWGKKKKKHWEGRAYSLHYMGRVTEMNTRNLPGGKGWPEREADNFTAICEPSI
jgi:hypothetical protein